MKLKNVIFSSENTMWFCPYVWNVIILASIKGKRLIFLLNSRDWWTLNFYTLCPSVCQKYYRAKDDFSQKNSSQINILCFIIEQKNQTDLQSKIYIRCAKSMHLILDVCTTTEWIEYAAKNSYSITFWRRKDKLMNATHKL